MSWSSLVIIPKKDGKHRGIGLLEVLWKLVGSIIEKLIKTKVKFHDTLHGFRTSRGTGTAVMEVKLLQKLMIK